MSYRYILYQADGPIHNRGGELVTDERNMGLYAIQYAGKIEMAAHCAFLARQRMTPILIGDSREPAIRARLPKSCLPTFLGNNLLDYAKSLPWVCNGRRMAHQIQRIRARVLPDWPASVRADARKWAAKSKASWLR